MDVINPSGCVHATRTRGYTLTELLIAVSVVSILLGMAAPSLSDLVNNSRMTSQINILAGHLNFARSEAIKSKFNVVVCKSQDGGKCTNSGEWTQGWILFTDIDADRQHDTSETLHFVQQMLGHGLSIQFGGFPTDNYVLYYPIGTTLGNGTFTICDSRGEKNAKALVLHKTGRLRTAHTMPNGSDLDCPET